LEVLLSVESNGLGLHLSLLDVNLVTGENDRNILANADQVTFTSISSFNLRETVC